MDSPARRLRAFHLEAGLEGLDITGNWEDRPLEFLTQLTKCTEGLVAQHVQTAVAKAGAQGQTWEAIGTALGVSRQSAWGRFAGDE